MQDRGFLPGDHPDRDVGDEARAPRIGDGIVEDGHGAASPRTRLQAVPAFGYPLPAPGLAFAPSQRFEPGAWGGLNSSRPCRRGRYRGGPAMSSLFTSESVTEGHPDKLADQISDAILDAILAKDPLARVACEAIVTTRLVIVVGGITTDCYVDIPRIIRQTVREVGYTRAKYGFDAETCGVVTSIDEQSPDIAQGVDVGGAGDSVMMLGFACDVTPVLMLLPITLAHRLARRLADVRRNKTLSYLRPDGKVQVTGPYGDDGKPSGVENVVLWTQNHDEGEADQLRSDIAEHVIDAVIPAELRDGSVRTFINPTGRFVIRGPAAGAGLTGRKNMVDTYGGFARHGGGFFSGKDPPKVGRAGAYRPPPRGQNHLAPGL